MGDTKGNIIEKTKEDIDLRTDEPPMYRVLLYNDDYTPKLFVVELLIRMFHKSPAEATELMWRVHGGEKGIIDVYPREIAETKVEKGIAVARENGFPLQLGMEPDT